MKNKPHKHAALIKAWADGAEIEAWSPEDLKWVRCFFPGWTEHGQYRIKPEPLPDFHRCVFVSSTTEGICKWKTVDPIYANLRLTFDGETGQLKDAGVLR